MTTPVIGGDHELPDLQGVFSGKRQTGSLSGDDMILDNRYLYDILTEGKYPERIPLEQAADRREVTGRRTE